MEKDNKNKKDMSVDDLVKQLKLVLDIDEDEEYQDAAKPEEHVIPDEPEIIEAPDENENEPLTAENAETISQKVRLLDRFFEEEEENKKKKKHRLRDRGKKAKKGAADKSRAEDITEPADEKPLQKEEKKPDKAKDSDFSDDDLMSFADEIGGMFSDPETEQPAAPESEQASPAPEPEQADAEPVQEQAVEEAAEEAMEEVEPEVPDKEENELETVVTTIDPDNVSGEADGLSDTEDLGPFVHNMSKTEKDDSEEEPAEGGQTKQFSLDKTVIIPEEDVSEPESPAADEQSDIEDFDVFFDDIHKESEDGYTAAEEAIMDTFAEKQEKPKKNPVKTFSDLSVDDYAEEEPEEKENKHSLKYDEFTDYDQRKTFLDTYKKKYLSLRTSLILSSIFAVLVFVYECLSFFGGSFPYFCSPETNPSVFILIDLQLFAICAIFAVTHIIDGFKGIFSGKASISSIAALSVLFTFIYGILAAVTGNPLAHPVMSASALCIVLMLFAKLRYVKRDTLNFRVVSGGAAKPKFVMESYVPGKNSPEEKEFYDYIPENAKMLRISKTEFVKGFVGSNMKPSSSNKYVNILLPVLALIFAVVLAVVLINKKDMSAAINAAYIASALCTPAAVFAAVTLPSYVCAKKTYEDDSCIVSEAAAEEYADASVVTFEDSDVFPPSLDKITSVRLYNDSRMDHIMYVLTSLFRKIGGPLLSICENAAKEYNEFSNNVVIDNAIENGIEATVDSQKVFLGSSVYMGSKLDPKYCIDDRQYAENDKSRIMYMIINDVVAAKFYIEYEMDKDFVSAIKQLSATTRCVAIRTLDPNIDTKLIKSYLDTEIYHCKIMRTRVNERRKTVSTGSRGAIVAKNSIKALLRSLMLCDKMVYSSKINMIICILSVIIGLIFGIFLILTKTVGSISALHVLAYQILLSVVIWIVTKINT